MAMVLKNNLSAVNTLNTLNTNSSELAKSLQKVSTGMRINGAGDDSANFAISEKMRAQIRGLEQDARNLQGGISFVRVGLGGMEQIKSNMAGMRELALGAANDTMTDQDRQISQKVVDQMIRNIDDIAVGTTFNDIQVLMAPEASGVSGDKSVDVVFVVDITGSMGGPISSMADKLGGFAAALRSMGKDFRFGLVQYGDIREAAGKVTKKMDFTEDEVAFEAALRELSVSGGGDEPESGLDAIMDDTEGGMSFDFRDSADKHIVVLTDASTLDRDDTAATGVSGDPGTPYSLGDVVDAAVEKGIIIDVVGALTDTGAYPRRSDWSVIQEGTGGMYFNIYGDYEIELMALAESFGSVEAQAPVYIHDGTRANQNIMINIYDHRAHSYGIDPLSISTRADASDSLAKIDKALDRLLDRATTYGAYINRMEQAFSNVTLASENTQASESVIRDADMAKEMVAYVKNNVLSQTSQSMLSQANQSLSGVLGLLE